MDNDNPSTDSPKPAQGAGLDGKPILVHKKDAEGGLAIGSLSGRILTPIMERPDWAEGLAVALLAERHEFYLSRLGPVFAEQRDADEVVAFEDLGWIAADATGEQTELEADSEFRMDVIAEAAGVIRTDDLSDTRQDDTTGELGHVLLDESKEYDHQDAPAFAPDKAAEADRKTGTAQGN
jgi:hypothetical protein